MFWGFYFLLEIYGGGPELFIKQNRGNQGGQSPPSTHKTSSSSGSGKSNGNRGNAQGDVEKEVEKPEKQQTGTRSVQEENQKIGQGNPDKCMEQDEKAGELSTGVERGSELESGQETERETACSSPGGDRQTASGSPHVDRKTQPGDPHTLSPSDHQKID